MEQKKNNILQQIANGNPFDGIPVWQILCANSISGSVRRQQQKLENQIPDLM